MRYVEVESVSDSWSGYSLNADEYLRILPDIQGDLPQGAREFATDEDHYNFFGPRCVKDLKLAYVHLVDMNGQLTLDLMFAPSKFKHDAGLAIRYADVTQLAVDVTAGPRAANSWPDARRLGDLQLDEVLPHQQGCSHEIRMTGGSILIVSLDLHAEWRAEEGDGADDAVTPGCR